MQLAMIGLGKMGGNMVRRLIRVVIKSLDTI
jgi:6-phosphogluconate dehydrogenase (decarboxylating)